MQDIVGTTWPVFVGVTVILIGGASYMTGQALAGRWRPQWQIVPYGLLLGFADRFLVYALFDGELLSLSGYVVDTLVIGVIAFASYRKTRARKMVTQYPWLYERQGLFGWRDRSHETS